MVCAMPLYLPHSFLAIKSAHSTLLYATGLKHTRPVVNHLPSAQNSPLYIALLACQFHYEQRCALLCFPSPPVCSSRRGAPWVAKKAGAWIGSSGREARHFFLGRKIFGNIAGLGDLFSSLNRVGITGVQLMGNVLWDADRDAVRGTVGGT